MARAKTMISIDEKIAKAQDAVERAKNKYDSAVAELKKVMEKKEEIKRAELIEAITKSNKSYDEILAFLRSDNQRNKSQTDL